MSTIEEIPVPGWHLWRARSDGTLRDPWFNIIKGWPGDKGGHLRVWINRPESRVYVHRFIALAFVKNPRPDVFDVVDHIDHDPNNNVPSNLRWVTHQLNCLNRKHCKGAYYVKKWKKWQSKVSVMGKLHTLGYYKTEEEAKVTSDYFRKSEFDRILQEYINHER